MGELEAIRQSEVVLPLRIGQQQVQVKLRVQVVGKILSLTNAEVALKYNHAAAVTVYAKIVVIAVAIVVMTFLHQDVVVVILPQA